MYSVRALLASRAVGADSFSARLAFVTASSPHWNHSRSSIRVDSHAAFSTSSFAGMEEARMQGMNRRTAVL